MFKQLLAEMPLNLGNIGSFYSTITKLATAAEKMGVEPEKVAYNIYKIVDDPHVLYYYEDRGLVISGVFLTMTRKNSFKISATGKHPDYIGRAPYTTDVYRAIINDLESNQALFSDTHLSNDSIKIWKRLAKEYPGRVMIYNRDTREVEPITNPNELQRAFGMSPSMIKYQFMIRGSKGTSMNRIKELAGIKK